MPEGVRAMLRRRVDWLRTTESVSTLAAAALAGEIEQLLDALDVDGAEPDDYYSAQDVDDPGGEYVGLLPAHVTEQLARDLGGR